MLGFSLNTIKKSPENLKIASILPYLFSFPPIFTLTSFLFPITERESEERLCLTLTNPAAVQDFVISCHHLFCSLVFFCSLAQLHLLAGWNVWCANIYFLLLAAEYSMNRVN